MGTPGVRDVFVDDDGYEWGIEHRLTSAGAEVWLYGPGGARPRRLRPRPSIRRPEAAKPPVQTEELPLEMGA